jgi:hypothetical protein
MQGRSEYFVIGRCKTGFPLANFLARSDLFPLSVSRITSARRGKMDAADKIRARKFASGKPVQMSVYVQVAGVSFERMCQNNRINMGLNL